MSEFDISLSRATHTMTGIYPEACLLILFLVSQVDSIELCDATATAAVEYDNYTVSNTDLCDCKKKPPCVRKCCRSGFYHYHDEDLESKLYVSVCIKNVSSSKFSLPIYDGLTKRYEKKDGFMIGMLKCNNKNWHQYFKMNKNDPRQNFFIQEDGSLYYQFYDRFYDSDRYCVDERDGLTAYLCFTPPSPYQYVEKVIHVSAKIVPLPFLLVTFLVYAVLPEPTLHSKALMCHVLALFFGYISLALSQYYVIEDEVLCQLLGFSIIYFMFSSFFWMNVMCIDIWYTFSGWRKCFGQKSMEKKVFILSCIYSWGLPGIFVLSLFFFNTYGDPNTLYYPRIGKNVCFLGSNLPVLLYYFSPLLILIIVNFVLFVLTAINIHRVKKETAMLNEYESEKHHNKDDQKKYRLYWKLLFAMGINPVINTHVIQTISWVVGWKLKEDTAKYIWYFKDFAHAMYGIFIFVIFVCKRKIWLILKKRYYKLTGKIYLNDLTPPTTSSNVSAKTDNGPGLQLSELKNQNDENV